MQEITLSEIIKKASTMVFSSGVGYEAAIPDDTEIRNALDVHKGAIASLEKLEIYLKDGGTFKKETLVSLLKLLGTGGWVQRFKKEAEASGILGTHFFDADKYRIRHKQYAGLGKMAAEGSNPIARSIQEIIGLLAPAVDLLRDIGEKYEDGVADLSKSPSDERYLNGFKHMYQDFLLDPQHGVVPELAKVSEDMVGGTSTAPAAAPAAIQEAEKAEEETKSLQGDIDSLLTKGESQDDEHRLEFDKRMEAMTAEAWGDKALKDLESHGFLSTGVFNEETFRSAHTGTMSKLSAEESAEQQVALHRMKREAEGCYKAFQGALVTFKDDADMKAAAVRTFLGTIEVAQERVEEAVKAEGAEAPEAAKTDAGGDGILVSKIEALITKLQGASDAEADIVQHMVIEPWHNDWSKSLKRLGLGTGKFDQKAFEQGQGTVKNASMFRIAGLRTASTAKETISTLVAIRDAIKAAHTAHSEGVTALGANGTILTEHLTKLLAKDVAPALERAEKALSVHKGGDLLDPVKDKGVIESLSKPAERSFTRILDTTGSYAKALYLFMAGGDGSLSYKGQAPHNFGGSAKDIFRGSEKSEAAHNEKQQKLKQLALGDWKDTLNLFKPYLADLDDLEAGADPATKALLARYREDTQAMHGGKTPHGNVWSELVNDLQRYNMYGDAKWLQSAKKWAGKLAAIYKDPSAYKEYADAKDQQKEERTHGRGQSISANRYKADLTPVTAGLSNIITAFSQMTSEHKRAQVDLDSQKDDLDAAIAKLGKRPGKAQPEERSQFDAAVSAMKKTRSEIIEGKRVLDDNLHPFTTDYKSIKQVQALFTKIRDKSSRDLESYLQSVVFSEDGMQKAIVLTRGLLAKIGGTPSTEHLRKDKEVIKTYLKDMGVPTGHVIFLPQAELPNEAEVEQTVPGTEEAPVDAKTTTDPGAVAEPVAEDAADPAKEESGEPEDEEKADDTAKEPTGAIEDVILVKLEKYLADKNEKDLAFSEEEANQVGSELGHGLLSTGSQIDPERIGEVVSQLQNWGFKTDGTFSREEFDKKKSETTIKMAYRKVSSIEGYYRDAYAEDSMAAVRVTQESLKKQVQSLRLATKDHPEIAADIVSSFSGALKAMFVRKKDEGGETTQPEEKPVTEEEAKTEAPPTTSEEKTKSPLALHTQSLAQALQDEGTQAEGEDPAPPEAEGTVDEPDPADTVAESPADSTQAKKHVEFPFASDIPRKTFQRAERASEDVGGGVRYATELARKHLELWWEAAWESTSSLKEIPKNREKAKDVLASLNAWIQEVETESVSPNGTHTDKTGNQTHIGTDSVLNRLRAILALDQPDKPSKTYVGFNGLAKGLPSLLGEPHRSSASTKQASAGHLATYNVVVHACVPAGGTAVTSPVHLPFTSKEALSNGMWIPIRFPGQYEELEPVARESLAKVFEAASSVIALTLKNGGHVNGTKKTFKGPGSVTAAIADVLGTLGNPRNDLASQVMLVPEGKPAPVPFDERKPSKSPGSAIITSPLGEQTGLF